MGSAASRSAACWRSTCRRPSGEIDGLCLIAPYPGSRLTTNAIGRASGLDAWQPTAEELRDQSSALYRWLKAPPAELPVFVGHGRDDRFVGRHAATPASRRTLLAGQRPRQ